MADLIIEIENIETGSDDCLKNPGHSNFIAYNDLNIDHILVLTNENQEKILLAVKREGKRVAKIEINSTKGTGYVEKYGGEYFIRTNNHLVGSDEEARSCLVKFNFNAFDSGHSIEFHGDELETTCPYRDVSWFTLNNDMPDFIQELGIPDKNILKPVMHVKISDRPGWHPIMSNYRIKNNNLLYFISKSTRNRDVKEIKIQFMGKPAIIMNRQSFSISLPVSSEDFFGDLAGVDKQKFLDLFPNGVNLLDIDPLPDDVQSYKQYLATRGDTGSQMFVIGHPHGDIKKVSFGNYLGSEVKRFNWRNERVGEDEEGRDVNFIRYSCPTCKGSSGSPVNYLSRFSNFGWSDYTHARGNNVNNDDNCAWLKPEYD